MCVGRELAFLKGGEEKEYATSPLLLVPSSSGVSPHPSQSLQTKILPLCKDQLNKVSVLLEAVPYPNVGSPLPSRLSVKHVFSSI